ncbi:hypothetical protein FLL79_03605 [Vibrio cholerae]|nr:hypothetical protein [Vibrio cholerae]NAO17968.1 hypothetical protein [Vibrio cholerae]NAO56818.1 hypothetical protein [Vibrio cholerae]RNE58054.1 hypothetical protein EEJ33_18895 [Vibrio cholerae]TQQ53366.1 hypothetical protein FLL79_03605 [Vibrio cholerae]
MYCARKWAFHIPFLLEVAAVLAMFVHPNHIVCLCSWGLTCRLPATPSCLGIARINKRGS